MSAYVSYKLTLCKVQCNNVWVKKFFGKPLIPVFWCFCDIIYSIMKKINNQGFTTTTKDCEHNTSRDTWTKVMHGWKHDPNTQVPNFDVITSLCGCSLTVSETW